MMKPELVTETSRLGLKDALNPVKAMAKKSEALAKPTYNAEVDQQVKMYVASIKEGAKQGQPFRHALFYGAPGTGKTLLAKTIAKDLGMHYAIINAANISQFSDKDAVLALNAIFDWAEQSQTVLFFDEVDAMAASRLGNVSEQHRKVLNTLLARTGTETKKFLMIGATNEPGLLDAAYMSRMDERIEFGLPDKSTRIELMKQYFKTYIGLTDKPATDASESQETTTTSTNDQTIKLPEDMDAQFHSLAERTEGFSGRELSQLVRAFRAELALTKDKTITPALMHRVIDIKIAQRKNLATYGKIAEVKFASATIPAAVSTTTTTTTQKQRNEAFEEVVKFNQQKHSNKRK
jgi:AAA+ superfamily predicted ATPase